MRFVKAFSIFTSLMLASACSTFSGSEQQSATIEQDALLAHAYANELETELVHVKEENARLTNQLLELQRDNQSLIAKNQAEVVRVTDLAETATLASVTVLAPTLRPQARAIIEPATSGEIENSDVKVGDAPRLVQPTFASTERVFENEADGEIETASVLFGVHLASYRRIEEAREGWHMLQRQNPDELGLLEPRLEKVDLREKGLFFRLIGGGFSTEGKASILCNSLKERGLFCNVSGFTGQRLSQNTTR